MLIEYSIPNASGTKIAAYARSEYITDHLHDAKLMITQRNHARQGMTPQQLFDNIPTATPLIAGTQSLDEIRPGIFKFRGIKIEDMPEHKWNDMYTMITGGEVANAHNDILGGTYRINPWSSVPVDNQENSLNAKLIEAEDIFEAEVDWS